MRRTATNETFALSAAGIDDFSAWLHRALEERKADRKNCLRACLMLEELLLRMLEQPGEDRSFFAAVDLYFGRPRIRLETGGEPFNPMSKTAEAFGDWNSSLMTAVGLHPKFSYSLGKNILRLTLPNRRTNAVVKMMLAVSLGVLLGGIGLLLLPQTLRGSITQPLLDTGFELWSRLLNAISGPIVFFMALTTILNTKGITRQGGSILFVIGRFFLFSTLFAAFAYVCARPFFTFTPPSEEAALSIARQGRDMLLELIPRNIVEPFLDADTQQLFLLAIICGGALVSLGDRAGVLKSACRQCNMIGLLIARWVSLLVPFVTGVFLILLIWSRQIRTITGMWLPMVLAAAVSLAAILCSVVILSLRFHVSFRTLLKKLKDPFLLTLRTGELDDNAYEEAERSCVRAFGVDRNYLKTFLPQGLVLYMPVSAIGALIFTMYTMQIYGVPVDLFRQFVAALFAVLLFVVTPPVPGQNLLSYAVIFSWLGIPEAAIIDAMFFEILFSIFSTAANLTMLQTETVFQARRLGMLNAEILRKK